MKFGFPRRLLPATLLALLLVNSFVVFAQAQNDAPRGNVRWLTYVDPRFHFSVRYPSNWQVIPRDDSDPDAVSGLLIFMPLLESQEVDVANAEPHDPGPHIIIVPYLMELEAGQSLSEWTDLYESLGHDSDTVAIQRQPRRVFRIRGAQAVYEEGVSPLTTYQFTNVAHGNVVWDIWTNISSIDPSAQVYNRMVRSFRFGPNSPNNLREAYGENFVPTDIDEAVRIDTQAQSTDALGRDGELPGVEIGIRALTSTWKAPVRKLHNGGSQWDVRCGSRDHDDVNTYASLAVDVYMPSSTPIYNAKLGTVRFAGFSNDGYGNLIRIQAQGGKEAYYAHLRSISSMTRVGSLISTYSYIGASGNTSTDPPPPSYPYHLHFHVQWNTSPEDLRGMEGFTATTYPIDDPDSGTIAVCGRMGI